MLLDELIRRSERKEGETKNEKAKNLKRKKINVDENAKR